MADEITTQLPDQETASGTSEATLASGGGGAINLGRQESGSSKRRAVRARRRRKRYHSQQQPTVMVTRLSYTASLPTRGTASSAGLDLYCSRTTTLPAISVAHGLTPIRVPTDICVALPPSTYGRITGRSGNTLRRMYVLAGVLDADYRGAVDVMMVNLSSADIIVNPGDRIAQLVIEHFVPAHVMEVDDTADLGDTVRGSGGFGSTGV